VRWIVLSCALIACSWVEGAAAAPTPRTESAHSGQATAELTYLFDDSAQDIGQRFAHLHVRVRRADAVLVDADVQPLCSGCLAWPASDGAADSSSVSVADLDRDGEPEVLFDLYTGGAHCCLYTMFFRFATGTYVRHVHSWGNPGYRLRDLGADGRPEFVTGDDRFNYAFSCYACSAVPVLVQQYEQGRLVNVTRRFPKLIRIDAARIWRFYRKAVRTRAYPNGLLPAYLADQYLLGKGTAGWARMRKAVRRSDWPSMVDPRWRNRARYLAAVRRFLIRTGYMR
jgi:hypothetical protein